MNNPLKPNFCCVLVLHASLLVAGCGDPLFASFVVRQDDDSTKQRDAARAAAHEGRPGDDSETKAGRDDGSVAAPANELTPAGCFALPDLSINANVDAGLVVAREAASQGCAAPDGGGATSAGTTYMRSDGLPLVEAGETYSLRWSSGTILTRVRLLGGAKTCSVDPLLFREPGTGVTPTLVINTCQEFEAPETAQHLRLYGNGHDFYSFGKVNANSTFELCPGSCPPNTQLVPDAAVMIPGLYDAGIPYVLPK